MHNNYYPERWVILRSTKADIVHDQVFAVWRGGFTTSDSWKLSSDIVSTAVEDNYYNFITHSGSQYCCHVEQEGTHGMGLYAISKLQQLQQCFESDGWNCSVIKADFMLGKEDK